MFSIRFPKSGLPWGPFPEHELDRTRRDDEGNDNEYFDNDPECLPGLFESQSWIGTHPEPESTEASHDDRRKKHNGEGHQGVK